MCLTEVIRRENYQHLHHHPEGHINLTLKLGKVPLFTLATQHLKPVVAGLV
jgi:hypothetical protein